MRTAPGQVSALLGDLRKGDPAAASRLLPIVYGERRRLAFHYMREEKPGQTIQATELVHEGIPAPCGPGTRRVARAVPFSRYGGDVDAPDPSGSRKKEKGREARRRRRKNPTGRGSRLFSAKVQGHSGAGCWTLRSLCKARQGNRSKLQSVQRQSRVWKDEVLLHAFRGWSWNW